MRKIWDSRKQKWKIQFNINSIYLTLKNIKSHPRHKVPLALITSIKSKIKLLDENTWISWRLSAINFLWTPKTLKRVTRFIKSKKRNSNPNNVTSCFLMKPKKMIFYLILIGRSKWQNCQNLFTIHLKTQSVLLLAWLTRSNQPSFILLSLISCQNYLISTLRLPQIYLKQ